MHDLDFLLSLLEDEGEVIPDPIQQASKLTKYAAITRYPGDIDPVTRQAYTEAIAIAEDVLHWAEERIK